MEEVSEQRTLEARGAELMKVYMCPEPTAETAPSFREGYDYYRTARAWHPRADNRYLRRSQAEEERLRRSRAEEERPRRGGGA